jgi:hypothetical protein
MNWHDDMFKEVPDQQSASVATDIDNLRPLLVRVQLLRKPNVGLLSAKSVSIQSRGAPVSRKM